MLLACNWTASTSLSLGIPMESVFKPHLNGLQCKAIQNPDTGAMFHFNLQFAEILCIFTAKAKLVPPTSYSLWHHKNEMRISTLLLREAQNHNMKLGIQTAKALSCSAYQADIKWSAWADRMADRCCKGKAMFTPPPSLLPAKPFLPPSAPLEPALALIWLSQPISLLTLSRKKTNAAKKQSWIISVSDLQLYPQLRKERGSHRDRKDSRRGARSFPFCNNTQFGWPNHLALLHFPYLQKIVNSEVTYTNTRVREFAVHQGCFKEPF